MNDEFGSSLREELSQLSEPPIGDLVGLAARRGRRIRRLRAAGAVTAVVAAATLTALVSAQLNSPGRSGAVRALPAAPGLAPGSPGASSPTASGTAVPTPRPTPGSGSAGPVGTAQPSPVGSAVPDARSSPTPLPHTSAIGEPLLPATGASLLSAVLQSLPAGTTTDTYTSTPTPGSPGVTLYLHSGGRTSRIGVTAFKSESLPGCQPGGGTLLSCSTDPAGNLVRVESMGQCIQNTVVTVYRRDGVGVQVDLSTCLNRDANGHNPAAPAGLTTDQAAELGRSSIVDFSQPASFVEAADKQYPDLPLTQ